MTLTEPQRGSLTILASSMVLIQPETQQQSLQCVDCDVWDVKVVKRCKSETAGATYGVMEHTDSLGASVGWYVFREAVQALTS